MLGGPFSRRFLVVALTLVAACVPRKRTPEQEASGAPSAENVEEQPAPAAEVRTPKRSKRARATSAARGRPAAPAVRKRRPPAPAGPDPLLTDNFRDDFERQQLGPNWRTTSSRWTIDDGQLCGQGARNHPVWLARRLPRNARIEFDAVSHSTHGDIKAEFWGDGKSAATGVSYTNATSYLTIFGGWKNQFHVLARIDEHAPDRQQIRVGSASGDLKSRPVEPRVSYHFKVERNDGKTIRWLVDDLELFVFTDPKPLAGAGHDHFGFNNWDVRLCFDNLVVTPLGE